MRHKYLAAGIAIFAVAGIWETGVGQEPGATKGRTDAAGLQQRGAYLVNAAILCGDCHTPQDDKGAPDKAKYLQGTSLPIRPKKETKNWADESPDITSKGLAGKWSEEEMIKFLTTGVDPHGMKAQPPMPAFRLTAADARAVAVYLKSLPGPNGGRDAEKKNHPE